MNDPKKRVGGQKRFSFHTPRSRSHRESGFNSLFSLRKFAGKNTCHIHVVKVKLWSTVIKI